MASLGGYRPDIIVLCAAKQSDPLTVHGVEVRGSYGLAVIDPHGDLIYDAFNSDRLNTDCFG